MRGPADVAALDPVSAGPFKLTHRQKRSSVSRRGMLKRFTLSLLLVPLLTAVFVVLAVLQYQWTGELSRAEQERMQKDLDRSTSHFREGLYRELAAVCAAFQMTPLETPGTIKATLARRWEGWAETATHPGLVAEVFICVPGPDGSCQLLRLDPPSLQFKPSAWPARFDALRPYLDFGELGAHGPMEPERHPFGWRFAENVPALLHPILEFGPAVGDEPRRMPRRVIGHCLIELSPELIRQRILPALAQSCFGGPGNFSNRVAVIEGTDLNHPIYQSDPGHSFPSLASADAVVPLISGGPEDTLRLLVESRIDSAGRGGPFPLSARNADRGQIRDRGRHMFPIIVPLEGGSNWTLVVENRSGSLQAAVTRTRLRSLAVGFGILGLLAASMAMIIVWTQRVQRLAKLQMEFVAGVSHELRTPLAVIRSAADNLADGVVTGAHQVHEYGVLISGHARRLSEIVDQVLMFAARKAGRISYELRPVRMDDVVEALLRDTASLIAASGFTLEKTVASGLPEVLADPDGLKHCLQNLISNALKYGGDRRWLGVRVERSGDPGGTAVQVTVEDKGPGISKEEQARIFDPFFRGVSAVAGQIRGTGLGLSLAMDIAEAMGGKLTVQSEPGQGSAFTLRLRAVPDGVSATNSSTQDLAVAIPSQANGPAEVSPGMDVKGGGHA